MIINNKLESVIRKEWYKLLIDYIIRYVFIHINTLYILNKNSSEWNYVYKKNYVCIIN